MAFLCALSLFLTVCALVGTVVLYVDLRGKRKTIDSMLARLKHYDRAFTALGGRVSRYDDAFTVQAGRIGSLATELATHAIRVGGQATRLEALQDSVRALARRVLPMAETAAALEAHVPADPTVETEGDRPGLNPGDAQTIEVEVHGPSSESKPIALERWANLGPEDLARVDALAEARGITREDMLTVLLETGVSALASLVRGPKRGPANGNGKH